MTEVTMTGLGEQVALIPEKEGEREKPWMCGPRGAAERHVLGQVIRNGAGVRRLLLYRNAVDLGAEEPGEVDVMAIVEGHVLDVRCSICGRVRTWVPGEEALRALIEGIKGRER